MSQEIRNQIKHMESVLDRKIHQYPAVGLDELSALKEFISGLRYANYVSENLEEPAVGPVGLRR